jgi:hypothetical protein
VPSLLKELSWQFSKPAGLIYDNILDNILEFFPAGYAQSFITKSSNTSGAAAKINRQEVFREIYERAELIGKESEQFPFADNTYYLSFIPEEYNKYDSFAIRIELFFEDVTYNIGYVPARINKKLLENRERITDKKILFVTKSLNDRFYCLRIGVEYDYSPT